MPHVPINKQRRKLVQRKEEVSRKFRRNERLLSTEELKKKQSSGFLYDSTMGPVWNNRMYYFSREPQQIQYLLEERREKNQWYMLFNGEINAGFDIKEEILEF